LELAEIEIPKLEPSRIRPVREGAGARVKGTETPSTTAIDCSGVRAGSPLLPIVTLTTSPLLETTSTADPALSLTGSPKTSVILGAAKTEGVGDGAMAIASEIKNVTSTKAEVSESVDAAVARTTHEPAPA
jgi:hypothetical protein